MPAHNALAVARTERWFRLLTCTIHGHNWADTAYGVTVKQVALGIRRSMPPITEEAKKYCMRCGKAKR